MKKEGIDRLQEVSEVAENRPTEVVLLRSVDCFWEWGELSIEVEVATNKIGKADCMEDRCVQLLTEHTKFWLFLVLRFPSSFSIIWASPQPTTQPESPP